MGTPKDTLPDKLYFTIGEVARIVDVAPHVLRYWEKEFPQVRPIKRAGNRRSYRHVDVETLLEIRHLLYERRFTVNGARDQLNRKHAATPTELLDILHRELLELRDFLTSNEGSGPS